MPIRNEDSTRFMDEVRIISPVAFVIAALGFIGMVAFVTYMTFHDKSPNPPPHVPMVIVGVIAGLIFGSYILLVGYVNRDAGRRRMGRVVWTLLSIFIPNALGIVLYFILRKPRTQHCPQCNTLLEPGFGFCPNCRYCLNPVCQQCQRTVHAGDKYCPYCGGDLASASAPVVAGAGTSAT